MGQRLIGTLTIICCMTLSFVSGNSSGVTANPSSPPSVASRIVKIFDFNERPLGNLEDIPMFWEKIRKPGFVHYVNGKLDDDIGSPAPSFRLELNGGNLGYIYTARKIPAFPGSDHKIIAKVKARNLCYARGYIEAFYMDRYGNILQDTLVRSPLIGPEFNLPGNNWRTISFELPHTNPQARFVGLAVFLVQQDRLPEDLRNSSIAYKKDIHATIWFDDITIIRLPQVRLIFPEGRLIYSETEKVPIEVFVADPVPEDLKANLSIQDLPSRVIKNVPLGVQVLPPLEAILQGEAPKPSPKMFTIGPLLPGLYQFHLQVSSGNMEVITRDVNVAVLPRSTPSNSLQESELSDLGLSIVNEPLSDEFVDKVVEVLNQLEPRWVLVPIWREDLPLIQNSIRSSPIIRLISKLDRDKISTVGGFISVPADIKIKAKFTNPSIYDLFVLPSDLWKPELSVVLSRYADRIENWVFGKSLDYWAIPDPRIETIFTDLRNEFIQFQDDFSLIVNWPGMVEPQEVTAVDSYMIKVPTELVPLSFSNYFSMWGNLLDKLWVLIERHDISEVKLVPALIDFCKRIVFAKEAGVGHIGVDSLWNYKKIVNKYQPQPEASFVVYANLLKRLGGLHFAGELQLAENCRGKLFCNNHKATIVVFLKEGGIKSEAMFSANLQAFDIWGRKLKLVSNGTSWEVKYSPVVFIQGFSPEVGRFISSVRFENPKVMSKFGVHKVKLIFKNTFGQSISGVVQIRGDKYWQFEPSGARFILGPEKCFDLPMKLRFPTNEPIGKKFITIRFQLEARRPIKLKILVPLSVAVSDLKMRILWFVRKGKLVIVQEIRNTGKRPADLIAYLIAPNQPRMERQIRKLIPGQVAVKEYTVGGWNEFYGKTIRVGFREIRGNRMGNEVITIR